MIHEEICTYEVCKLAKEKGFNGLCYEGYDRKGELLPNNIPNPNMQLLLIDCIAPTQSLLHRWLREEKGYYTFPFFNNEEMRWSYIVEERRGEKWFSLILNTPNYDSYEVAMENALKFVLEKLV